MRKELPEKLESARMEGDRSWGPYGRFILQGPCGARLWIDAAGADIDPEITGGWEHVIVSTHRRCPNWQEMCFVKDLFWDAEECVIQFHPPRSEYVNNNPYELHLWKHESGHPTPPITVSHTGRRSFKMLWPEWPPIRVHLRARTP